MSLGGMLYLTLVVVTFLCFAGTLMRAMLLTSRRDDAPRDAAARADGTHGRWSHHGAG
ncbi:MAG TPA: hypothetical protein VFA22_08515 [Stellaceae bacterium]|nr:hypothetical protein [Stellaceae bacterium]